MVGQSGVGTQRRLINLGRTFHIQSFMETLVVERCRGSDRCISLDQCGCPRRMRNPNEVPVGRPLVVFKKYCIS